MSDDCWTSWSVEDPRSRNWWDRTAQAMIAGLRPVLIGEIVATALEEGSLEELSPLGRATVDAWYAFARSRDQESITLRNALLLILIQLPAANGYIAQDLQDSLLQTFGSMQLRTEVSAHAASFQSPLQLTNPTVNSVQRAALPPSLMPVRDAGAPLRAVSVSAGDAGNGSATGIASSAQLGADSTRPGRGQRRPASPAGRPQRRPASQGGDPAGCRGHA